MSSILDLFREEPLPRVQDPVANVLPYALSQLRQTIIEKIFYNKELEKLKEEIIRLGRITNIYSRTGQTALFKQTAKEFQLEIWIRWSLLFFKITDGMSEYEKQTIIQSNKDMIVLVSAELKKFNDSAPFRI